MSLFGPKNAVFWPEINFFSTSFNFFVTIMTGHQKDPVDPVDPVVRRASGRPPGPIFGPKICIFLRYTYETPIFSGQTDRTGPIISPPYPEVTLDTFGFPVGGRFAVRRAVFRHRLPKVALFGPKSAVFGPKSIFLCTSSNLFVTIMTRH